MGRGEAPTRRQLLGAAAVAPFVATGSRKASGPRNPAHGAVLVGSANALAGMKLHYAAFAAGGSPLDAAIATVKVTEADPEDTSVGLGGLPNEEGIVQLDAACMDGRTHNSGAVAALENILHPSEVARLVMERTDHCQIFGEGAYRFARLHGHPHTELLTDKARGVWLRWKETMSERDDWLAPPAEPEDEKHGARRRDVPETAHASIPWHERHGTIHCSALSTKGDIACTTTTSGLAFKIPGRVGDSPIIGAGLYCDQEAGSAGATGRGEAAILSCGSAAIVEELRRGAAPLDAGLAVLRRIVRQTERMAKWQPRLLDDQGRPRFGLNFYVLALDGRWAGVTLSGERTFAVADADGGPRIEPLVPLFE